MYLVIVMDRYDESKEYKYETNNLEAAKKLVWLAERSGFPVWLVNPEDREENNG